MSNIPLQASESDLRLLFEGCEEVRLIRDQKTQKSKGFAYIQLQDEQAYQIALSLTPIIFNATL